MSLAKSASSQQQRQISSAMAQSNDGALSYQTLCTGGFRVLVIRRSRNPAAEIQCRLVREQLPGNTPYDALSYTWGTEPPSQAITINGWQSFVRENLYRALRRLRRKKTERRIWIDAVCINQLDIEERNAQVDQMKEIFANARRVHIWLGEEDAEGSARRAFRFIPRFTRFLTIPGWVQSAHGLIRKLTDSEFLENIHAIFVMIERPWWRRIWVLQEVAVSNQPPKLCWGPDTLDWKAFDKFTHYWLKYQGAVFNLLSEDYTSSGANAIFILLRDRLAFASSLTLARLHHHYEADNSMVNLLDDTSTHISTDPRDRVFGILGLARPSFPLHADYHRSLEWVNIFQL